MATRAEESELEWEEVVHLHDAIAHLEAAADKLSIVEGKTLNPLMTDAQRWRDQLAPIIAEARTYHDEALAVRDEAAAKKRS